MAWRHAWRGPAVACSRFWIESAGAAPSTGPARYVRIRGDWAWVIDTFVPPGTPLHPRKTTPAWLAGFVSERLAALALDATDEPLLARRVMTEASDAFLAKAPPDSEDFMTWPAGAMALLRARVSSTSGPSATPRPSFRQADGIVRTIGEARAAGGGACQGGRSTRGDRHPHPKTLLPLPVVRQWLKDRREQLAEEARPCSALRPGQPASVTIAPTSSPEQSFC